MIQTIVDYIVAALRESFPHIEKIYTEPVEQGLKTPCFIVRCVNPTNKHSVGERYYRTNLFSVHYIPESDMDAQAECSAIIDSLFYALEYIGGTDDLTRGTEMSGELVDGGATFLVSYNFFVHRVAETEPMEELETLNTHMKG